MLITSIQVENFLSFDRLDLADLDAHLNVIVGPNGAGKTNLIRVLEMVRDGFGDGPGDWRARQDWTGSNKLDSSERGFSAQIDLQITEEWERELLTVFVASLLADRSIDTALSRHDIKLENREKYSKWLQRQITPGKLESLFKGKLEMRFSGAPENWWDISYEFKHPEHRHRYRYRWVMESRDTQEGLTILAHRSGEAQRTIRLDETVARVFQDNLESPLSAAFDFSDILPKPNETVVGLEIPSSSGGELLWPLRRFGQLTGKNMLMANRRYTLRFVFALLFHRNIFTIQDLRIPPTTEYNVANWVANWSCPLPDLDLSSGAEVPLYLSRLKNGSLEERKTYENVCKVFNALTNQNLDLRTEPEQERRGEPESSVYRIEPVVVLEGEEIPVRAAGAGISEALTLSALFTHPRGKILLLDEPALNLHPNFQRRLLGQLRESEAQHFLVTHSPYLIPTDHEEDLYRVLRFYHTDEGTRVVRLERTEQPSDEERKEVAKLIREMTKTTDTPALLFSQAVILVEGDTESGALPVWFAGSETGKEHGDLTAFNIALISVGGHYNFGTYVTLLNSFKIPWAIICDGKILEKGKILKQIGRDKSAFEDGASFEEHKELYKGLGVFTLVEEPDHEFENLAFVEPHLDEARGVVEKSKVRQGRYIAQKVDCPPAVDTLYHEILTHLGLM